MVFQGLDLASLGLAWASQGLAQALGGDGWTDGQTNGRTDGWTEFLPILQDFVPYRGRCQAQGGQIQALEGQIQALVWPLWRVLVIFLGGVLGSNGHFFTNDTIFKLGTETTAR